MKAKDWRPLKPQTGPAARVRFKMDPSHKQRPVREEVPGWHTSTLVRDYTKPVDEGAKVVQGTDYAMLPETEGRKKRAAEIKRRTEELLPVMRHVGDVTVADVKRRRAEVVKKFDERMDFLLAWQRKAQNQIEAGFQDAQAKETHREMMETFLGDVDMAKDWRAEQMQILEQEEAFLADHEKKKQDLQTLKTTHKRAQVVNKVKRVATKVAKTAGDLASAITGYDREAADVDVVN